MEIGFVSYFLCPYGEVEVLKSKEMNESRERVKECERTE